MYSTIGTAPIEIIQMISLEEIKQTGVISVAELDAGELMKRIAKRGRHIVENTELKL